MSNRFVKFAVTVGAAILIGVALVAVGLSANIAFSVTIGLIVGGAFSFIKPSTSQVLTSPTSVKGETSSTDDATTFTNVVFSKHRVFTLFREVGVVTITPQAVSIVGKKKSLRIDAPFAAELFDSEAMRWPMIRVKKSGKTMLPAKAFLVVRGAPRERGKDIAPAVREVMIEESLRLMAAINMYN